MRITRIAALADNTPVGIDVGITSPGKILIQNTGTFPILIGQDRSDVLAATAGNAYLTLQAGVLLVFDVGPEIGYLGQRQMWWFASSGGQSSLEVAVFGVDQ